MLWSVSLAAANEGVAAVPLCRALESIRFGDIVRIEVSGIYAGDYLYDPAELRCNLRVEPGTCVEFAPNVEIPDLLREGRARVTFRGLLIGPPPVSSDDGHPSKTDPARAFNRVAARNEALYCGHMFRTKIVVDEIVSIARVPDAAPWPETRKEPPEFPSPIRIDIPQYPAIARAADYQGIVLLTVAVERGRIVDVGVQFGDPLLTVEAIRNIRTWRFATEVSTRFTVEYDFRLEKRKWSESTSPRIELDLPLQVRVIGASKEL